MSNHMLTALRVHAEVTSDETAGKLLLMAAAEIARLREALRLIRDASWTDGEEWHNRVADLQKIAADALAVK